jgi:hypothetical protein
VCIGRRSLFKHGDRQALGVDLGLLRVRSSAGGLLLRPHGPRTSSFALFPDLGRLDAIFASEPLSAPDEQYIDDDDDDEITLQNPGLWLLYSCDLIPIFLFLAWCPRYAHNESLTIVRIWPRPR